MNNIIELTISSNTAFNLHQTYLFLSNLTSPYLVSLNLNQEMTFNDEVYEILERYTYSNPNLLYLNINDKSVFIAKQTNRINNLTDLIELFNPENFKISDINLIAQSLKYFIENIACNSNERMQRLNKLAEFSIKNPQLKELASIPTITYE